MLLYCIFEKPPKYAAIIFHVIYTLNLLYLRLNVSHCGLRTDDVALSIKWFMFEYYHRGVKMVSGEFLRQGDKLMGGNLQ